MQFLRMPQRLKLGDFGLSGILNLREELLLLLLDKGVDDDFVWIMLLIDVMESFMVSMVSTLEQKGKLLE